MSDKKLVNLETEGYVGVDADLATSLFEYGLAWKLKDNVYNYIFGVEVDKNGNFCNFSNSFLNADTDWKRVFDWIDIEDVERYCDEKLETMPLTQIVETLVSYCGYENVFGPAYYTFKIEDNN